MTSVMTESPLAASRKQIDPARSQLWVLAALVGAELLIFSIIGTRFATRANFLQIPRLSVELGLLALAQTLVIVTGGIDLSVGSLLGLCAILFGKMWQDGGFSPWMAAGGAIAIGAAAGGFNALLITRLRIPALIVTLGTYSLFRGLAEGITGGVKNYTDFPASFLFLGQEQIASIPAQVPILIVAAIVFWILLHRMTFGRALSAIGYNAEGARYAGIRVQKNVGLTYVLSGLCAGIAAVVYAARVGQAKADAGSGYELIAITAVVLGGHHGVPPDSVSVTRRWCWAAPRSSAEKEASLGRCWVSLRLPFCKMAC